MALEDGMLHFAVSPLQEGLSLYCPINEVNISLMESLVRRGYARHDAADVINSLERV